MMMRHIVWRVREEVGDGSATTAVLALAIAKEVQKMIIAGANPMLLKRGIERAVDAAVQALEAMAIPLEGEERIAAVATAATGNERIGKILGEMYDFLGPNANIVIEPYIALYHDRAYYQGARFRGQIVSPYLMTDATRRVAVLKDPYIVVTDMSFETVSSVQGILEQVYKAGGKSVFIICKMMADKAIGVLVANNERGTIQSCAANIRYLGDVRRGTIQDIAILVGAKAFVDSEVTPPESITLADMGRADTVIVTYDHYDIIGGKGDPKAIQARAQALRKQLRETLDVEQRQNLRDLLRHFSAGIGELRIGALTEQERKAEQEVAEQAMKAINAGMESGVVPGGGAAYLNCIPAVEALEAEGDEAFGIQIVARALEEPMRRIAANAGVHPPLVIAEARRAGPGYGYDVRQKKVVNMIEAGIADPALVVKRALQNAASGALMLLTTETLVLHRNPKENFNP